MKKIIVNKIIILTLTIIFLVSLIPISSACTPKLAFEDIVISSSVESDTYEPLDTKTEFNASAEHIYATIKYSGVKGSDNWRFKWTNLDTGEIVLDKGDQYNKDQKEKYMEGIIESDIYPADESSIIPPGDYKVEFYNNGELIKTTTFKVNMEEVVGAAVTFDKSNEYSSTDFGFTITIPDNWTYEESKTAQVVDLSIAPPSQDIKVGLLFKAVNPKPDSSYEDFADNDSASFAEQQGWTFIEKVVKDAVLENDTGNPCKEYSYTYTDNENTAWVIVYCFTENSDKLYLLIVITDENNNTIAYDAYVGILNSLIFD